MFGSFFESFEDTLKTDDSCEVHISDSEEELPRFAKKSVSVRKTGNADLLPKTSPCDYSLAVKEWNFCKTETAKLLQPSSELKKLNSREKRQSVKSILDTSKNSEDCNKKKNSLEENRVPLNLPNIPEDKLYESDGGKSVLIDIQNVNSLHQSVSISAKSCLPIKKPAKFTADCDLLSGVQVTPRGNKIKPPLLKHCSSYVFINSHVDFKIHEEKCPAVSKYAGTSDCLSHMQSLGTPKVKKIMLPQALEAKRNASSITSESFVEYEGMCREISKDANSLVDCSFFGDLQATSKVKKVKVEEILNDEKKVFSGVSLNCDVSQDECPEISESSGSVVKGGSLSASQSAVNEDYDISDCSDNLTLNKMSQSRTFLDRRTDKERCSNRENLEHINGRTEGNEVLQKTSCPQNVVSSMHKGSEYVKSIKLHQESTPKPKKELEFHSEKRKKYLLGGLAEQAQKLEHREKSSIVLWCYQKNNEAGIGPRRYISLKIHLFSVVDSFVITKCEILKDSSISVEQKRESLFNYVFQKRNGSKGELKTEHFSEQNSSKESSSDFKDNVCSNILGRKREKFKDCLVAIKLETWKRLKLTTDAIIRIFPPWQTLWINSLNVHVLLCTYFMEMLSTPPSVEKLPSEKVLYSRAASCTSAVLSNF